MSSIVIKGNTSGQIELAAPDVAGSTTLTLPTGSGTVITDTAPKAGSVIQVVSATSNAVTISTSTPTPIVSLNITTTGSSKLYCAFSSDLNADTGGAWKWNGLQVDGTWITRNISSTADASFQSCVSLVGLSGTLSAGSHSVVIAGWNGAGTSTYAEGNNNGNSLVVMEVAA